MTRQNELTTIGFGGGCHWCTEAVFASLRGVGRVELGFIRSEPPDDTWSEAVRFAFDADLIPLDVLIEIHLRTHSSSSNHKMRGKYRSAVYVTSKTQGETVRHILDMLRRDFEEQLVTQVLSLSEFKLSDARFHQYYERNAGGPFCTRYIDPKLGFLRDNYAVFTA